MLNLFAETKQYLGEKMGMLWILLLTHLGISTLSVNKKNTLTFNREAGMWLGYWEEQKFSQNVLLFPISLLLILLNYCVLIKFTDGNYLKRKLYFIETSVSSPICEINFYCLAGEGWVSKDIIFILILPKTVAFSLVQIGE